ncbi:hypothetical protein EBU99_06215 [bacterium]|nr:hypothetical protein [bacterium]
MAINVQATALLTVNASPGTNSPQSQAADLSTQKIDAKKEIIDRRRAEAEKVAQDFETMFIDMVVKSMRQTAQPEDLSNAEDIYQGMLDSEYSKSMTATQTFGIREQILNWLEQTDPEIKRVASDSREAQPSQPAQNSDKTVRTDALNLQNESWALKAATQAYRLSAQPR